MHNLFKHYSLRLRGISNTELEKVQLWKKLISAGFEMGFSQEKSQY